MLGKADIFFMSAIGGILTVDLTLTDGSQWHFDGGFGSLGTPVAGAMGDELVADFPGLDHIEGGCAFEVKAAGFDASACVVHFFDLHPNPTIGTVAGSTYGGSLIEGFGGGTWSNARHRPAVERARAAVGAQV